MISSVMVNSICPSCRGLRYLKVPTFSTWLFSDMKKTGFTQIRLKPNICWAYMPPILVPTMTSGCFFLHSSFRNGSATAGSTGISGAMISKSCSRSFSVSMVLLAAEEPKTPFRSFALGQGQVRVPKSNNVQHISGH